MLPKRPLGSTGIDVSILGLGTVKLGRNQGVKYPQPFTIPDDKQAHELLEVAHSLGINLLDTAPAYGNSEKRLGKLLTGQRHKWLICSKVGEEYIGGQSFFDYSSQSTRASVERSLRRLNTDYLDMVLVHSDGNDLHIINHCGTLDTLNTLKQEGKIRAIGMSTKTVEGGLLAAQLSDCVMVTWNLGYNAELPVIDYCHENHKGVLIKKALASGHISTEYQDPVHSSFSMLFSHPGVSSAIVGTINLQHLCANIATACAATHPI